MPNVTEHEKYVAVNPKENNNKFWEFTRYDDGTVTYTFGRIGVTSTTTKPEVFNDTKHNAKLREKTGKKGYQKIDIVASPSSSPSIAGAKLTTEQVKKIAAAEIGAGDPVVTALVKKLAEANRHELLAASGGDLDIDLSTGIVKTAMGVVTAEAVTKARTILPVLSKFVTKNDTDSDTYATALGSYLKLVPQRVDFKRGWHKTFLSSKNDVLKQNSLLDQLETSIDLANQRMADAAKAPRKDGSAPATTFEVKLKIVSDPKVMEMVKKLYADTAQRQHSSSRLKPVRIYEVCIPHMASGFEGDGRKVGNIKMLWHGTRMFNVLSILKRGLIMPKTLSTMNIAGAMFGDGLYFSDQSTKSLNYAYGYWDGGRKDSNCFMFLVDVAMGREYTPSYSGNGKRDGYDSCFAKAGRSGVMNNEMIVYRTSQANPRYLVEFAE